MRSIGDRSVDGERLLVGPSPLAAVLPQVGVAQVIETFGQGHTTNALIRHHEALREVALDIELLEQQFEVKL